MIQRTYISDFYIIFVLLEYCKKIADPYVEHDNVIVSLDALRMKLPVYRHIMWNAFERSHIGTYMKLLVAVIFFSTYARLFSLSPGEPFKDVFHNITAFFITFWELVAFSFGSFLTAKLLLLRSKSDVTITLAHHAAATIVGSAPAILFVTILVWSFEPNFVAPLRLLLLASHLVSTQALIEQRGGNIFVAAFVICGGAAARALLRSLIAPMPMDLTSPLMLSLFG